MLLFAWCGLTGCATPDAGDDNRASAEASGDDAASTIAGHGAPRIASQPATPLTPSHVISRRIDELEVQIASASSEQPASRGVRRGLLDQRWRWVRLAAAHHATAHRDALYGSRAYWHTNQTRGLSFTLDEPGDLDQPFFVDGRANARVAGDVNADIEFTGAAVVHILGDLNATLTLTGINEVVIAGNVTPQGAIQCDGQVELFVAGDFAGQLSATRSASAIVDGDLAGTIDAGSPSTTLTATGDYRATVTAPGDEPTVLTLRVDGFAATQSMLDLSLAGFTRVNATVGRSDVPPGLYPEHDSAVQPVARWVVLQSSD